MVNVYLAAQYSQKEKMKEIATKLREVDINVTSSWLEEVHPPDSQMADVPQNNLLLYARTDLREIDQADWFVFHSVSPTTKTVRGGRHVEFGYAIAKEKKILVVGPKENIFHHLPQIRHVREWSTALSYFKFLSKEKHLVYS